MAIPKEPKEDGPSGEGNTDAGAKPTVNPPLPDVSTATAVKMVLSPVEELAEENKTELRARGAKEALLARLEVMEGSRTRLGLRTEDGTLFEIVIDRGFSPITCRRTIVAKGSSLPNKIELTISFGIPLDFDPTGENILREEKDTWAYVQYMCYTALGSNPGLKGRLRLNNEGNLNYLWRGEEAIQIPLDDKYYKIFFSTKDFRQSKFTRKFNPATVTSIELDRAIAKLRGVPLLPAEEPPPYKPAEMPETYEVIAGSVDEIATNSLDAPKFVKAKNGTVAYGSDEGVGSKEWNEDRVTVNTGDGNGFVVIDGMGGEGWEGCGETAAQILAEEFQKGFQNGTSFEDIQKFAHQRMAAIDLGDGGACYVGFRIEGKKLNIAQAGDCKLIVLDKNGVIKFATTDEGFRNMVSNAITGNKQGKTTKSTADLEVGDHIVVASDGLFDNLSPQEVADLIRGKTIREAIFLLNTKVKEKMECFRTSGEEERKNMQAKPDNISILIYDIENLS